MQDNERAFGMVRMPKAFLCVGSGRMITGLGTVMRQLYDVPETDSGPADRYSRLNDGRWGQNRGGNGLADS